MKIIGVDLHARQQTIAMLDTDTGELVEKTLEHAGDEVRKFYSTLSGQVVVGLEATGSMPLAQAGVFVWQALVFKHHAKSQQLPIVVNEGGISEGK